ncbi:RICIN domain-containing protein [Rhodococcus marinonascens]|uniref:RICIN domain-containing protein n=1 Tax=Rhodococcus marinonascens TaxID=38311 RepID=UPI000932DBF7|nr:RICIN domain-containing protein [Rhodococcus marinonascens]
MNRSHRWSTIAAAAALAAGTLLMPSNIAFADEDSPGGMPLTGAIPGPVSPLYGLNGRVADILDHGTASGTPVQMWDLTGAENQQWTLFPVPRPPGQLSQQLYNEISQKCLAATEQPNPGDPYPNGTPVELQDCASAGSADSWVLDDAVTDGSPGGGALANFPSERCLDVIDNVSANGVRLQLWDCTGGFNQKWNFPPTSTS